jgi:hypothetical protein
MGDIRLWVGGLVRIGRGIRWSIAGVACDRHLPVGVACPETSRLGHLLVAVWYGIHLAFFGDATTTIERHHTGSTRGCDVPSIDDELGGSLKDSREGIISVCNYLVPMLLTEHANWGGNRREGRSTPRSNGQSERVDGDGIAVDMAMDGGECADCGLMGPGLRAHHRCAPIGRCNGALGASGGRMAWRQGASTNRELCRTAK